MNFDIQRSKQVKSSLRARLKAAAPCWGIFQGPNAYNAADYSPKLSKKAPIESLNMKNMIFVATVMGH